MTKNTKTAAFLQALSVPTVSQPAQASPVDAPANDQPKAKPRTSSSRHGLKHIGGYFERADVEKIAILRARLGLDNSELIKLAIDELYRKHEARRAFGEG
jgi:hypothetical protein